MELRWDAIKTAAPTNQAAQERNDSDGYLISHFVDVSLINGVSLNLSDWKFMLLSLGVWGPSTCAPFVFSGKNFCRYPKRWW